MRSEQFIRHLFALSDKTDFSKPQKQRPPVYRGLVLNQKCEYFDRKASTLNLRLQFLSGRDSIRFKTQVRPCVLSFVVTFQIVDLDKFDIPSFKPRFNRVD